MEKTLLSFSQLVSRTKLPWKHVGRVPSVLIERRRELLRLRSPRQVKLAARAVFERRQMALASEAGKMGQQAPKPGSIPPGLASYGPGETVAYVSRRMLPAHAITRRVFAEAKYLMPQGRPVKNILDFGTGPGTAIWAAGQVWPDTLKYAHGVENHRAMLDALDYLWKGDGERDSGSIGLPEKGIAEKSDGAKKEAGGEEEQNEGGGSDWLTNLDDVGMTWTPPSDFSLVTSTDLIPLLERLEHRQGTGGGQHGSSRFDLVTAAWVLGDVAAAPLPWEPGQKKPRAGGLDSVLAHSHALWALVQPGGLLVLVEPGNKAGAERIVKVREALLDYFGPSELEVVAPCTHRHTCPLAGGDGKGQKRSKSNGSVKGAATESPELERGEGCCGESVLEAFLQIAITITWPLWTADTTRAAFVALVPAC